MFFIGVFVLTENGNKPIEEIQAGDFVYSTNPETGESEYKEVVQVFENETNELVHLTVNGEEIVTTPKHPFYVPQRGWINAIDLKAGDILVLSNGEYVTVEQVQHEILETTVKVYNFEVEDFHTYYVGENSVLVHNLGCGDNDINALESIENTPFYKSNGGSISEDFISVHSQKHMYNADVTSTAKKTQYGKNVNVAKLCEDTMLNPDAVIYISKQNVIKYVKDYNFNISTDATPTGKHRVFIPLNHGGRKTVRMSQFPLFLGGGN